MKLWIVSLVVGVLLVLLVQPVSSEESPMKYELKYHPFYLLERFQADSTFPNDLTPKTDKEIIKAVMEDKFPTTKHGPRIE